MRNILTEESDNKIYFLRRFQNDWKWIEEIVKEGMDLNDPCHYSEKGYIEEVIEGSVHTYLFNYFYSWKSEDFKRLTKFLSPIVYQKFGKMILDYYTDYDFECDEK